MRISCPRRDYVCVCVCFCPLFVRIVGTTATAYMTPDGGYLQQTCNGGTSPQEDSAERISSGMDSECIKQPTNCFTVVSALRSCQGTRTEGDPVSKP